MAWLEMLIDKPVDASPSDPMADYLRFFRFKKRRKGFLGIFGDALARGIEGVEKCHIEARRRWPEGEIGMQMLYVPSSGVRVLALITDGRQVAALPDELELPPRGTILKVAST